MSAGFRIGRISGIDIVLDWSLALIFVLVAVSLGAGVLPAWHPQWNGATVWLTAAAASVLFLASVLVHELSHALVGRTQGVPVRRIVLFVFGGMAQLEREPNAWRAELRIAIVGPLTSLLIGVGCLFAGALLAPPGRFDPQDPVGSLAALGPAATVLLWLGPVNIALAVFNMLPGFPLDGGRVLRALLWGATGDEVRATRWAAGMGRGLGLLLIALGVLMFLGVAVPYFGTGTFSGLWLVLIGWFLHNAALMGLRQLQVRRSLDGVRVEQMMTADFVAVDPGMPLQRFIDDVLLVHTQRDFPVVQDGRLVGLAGLDDVRRLDPAARAHRTVGEVMRPAERLVVLEPGADAEALLRALSSDPVTDPLPVVSDGAVRGLVRREDVHKWLVLHRERGAFA